MQKILPKEQKDKSGRKYLQNTYWIKVSSKKQTKTIHKKPFKTQQKKKIKNWAKNYNKHITKEDIYVK